MQWEGRLPGTDVPPSPQIMPPAIWRLLFHRGAKNTADIQNIFSPSLKDLKDPFLLKDMDKTCERLAFAIENQQQIAVYADYDLDGSPGGVLMKKGLEALGATEVILRQPKRLKDGYGVHKKIIDELKEQKVQLIISVDVGITDNEAIAHANSKNIDFIVTDHHLPKEQLPKAYAIVNPNSGLCDSGLTYLSGTGVAFYVIMALRSALKKTDVNLKDFLDLFAIATITDMVPLVNENRTLVKHGLKVLETTQRPGLQALLQELKLYGKEILSSDIGFKLGPKLNALSRLEEDLFPADVMLADHQTAKDVVHHVMALNDKRRELQEGVYADALDKINFQLANDPSYKFVSVFSKDYHPGVISVVANKLMDVFKRPVFIGSQRPEGHIIGSARSPLPEVDLQKVLGYSQKHLMKFGGHRLAAGFEISPSQTADFETSLTEYFNSKEGTFDQGDFRIMYDAELSLDELNESFMRWYAGLEPFGVGFEQPVFMIRGLKLKQIKELKPPHLKLILADKHRSIDALWFSAPADHGFQEGKTVDVLGHPAWNEWRGRKSLQWLLSDIRPG